MRYVKGITPIHCEVFNLSMVPFASDVQKVLNDMTYDPDGKPPGDTNCLHGHVASDPYNRIETLAWVPAVP